MFDYTIFPQLVGMTDQIIALYNHLLVVFEQMPDSIQHLLESGYMDLDVGKNE